MPRISDPAFLLPSFFTIIMRVIIWKDQTGLVGSGVIYVSIKSILCTSYSLVYICWNLTILSQSILFPDQAISGAWGE